MRHEPRICNADPSRHLLLKGICPAAGPFTTGFTSSRIHTGHPWMCCCWRMPRVCCGHPANDLGRTRLWPVMLLTRLSCGTAWHSNGLSPRNRMAITALVNGRDMQHTSMMLPAYALEPFGKAEGGTSCSRRECNVMHGKACVAPTPADTTHYVVTTPLLLHD